MIKAVIFDMFETLITHYHQNASVYFGPEMAIDADIPEDVFLRDWRESEWNRSIGVFTVDEVVERILKKNGKYTEERCRLILDKIIEMKIECFRHMDPDIIPMMEALKERGIKIGLVSNCYNNEAEVIRGSRIFPYFDVVCMSSEEGVRKPNHDIFLRCVDRLGVKPEECIYVGDGGSEELPTAKELGMIPQQAAWYLVGHRLQPSTRMQEYEPMERPLELIDRIENH